MLILSAESAHIIIVIGILLGSIVPIWLLSPESVHVPVPELVHETGF